MVLLVLFVLVDCIVAVLVLVGGVSVLIVCCVCSGSCSFGVVVPEPL